MWFNEYLMGKSQFVKYKNYISWGVRITSGVTYCSHCNPYYSIFMYMISDVILNQYFLDKSSLESVNYIMVLEVILDRKLNAFKSNN